MSSDQDPPLADVPLIHWILLLIFCGGVAAGPGYYIYCTSFSGKLVDSYAIRHTVRGGQLGTQPIALDAEMNPLILKVHATIEGPTSGHVGYWATLYDNRTPLIRKRIQYSLRDDTDRTATRTRIDGGATLRLEVPGPGNYIFALEDIRVSDARVNVSGLELEVRRNAREPNMRIVWWGVGALVASILLGLLFR